MIFPNNQLFFNQTQIDWKDVFENNFSKLTTNQKHAIAFLQKWLHETSEFDIQTSGSTGAPKTIKINRSQLIASAIATGKALRFSAGENSLVCLSAKYIAGIMMLTRAMVWNQNIYIVEPSNNPLSAFSENFIFNFAALVPLQTQTIIEEYSIEALSRINKILVGGAPLSFSLKEKLAEAKSEIYLTYGMTETISHIALQKISGLDRQEKFYPLPGIRISVNEENCLLIQADYLNETIRTSDVVKLYADSSFEWLGRADFVINSGGIKIHPESIEKQIESFLKKQNIDKFFISSLPDEKFGEKLILIIETNQSLNKQELLNSIKQILPAYHNPKEVFVLPQFINTETGKINRKATLNLLKVGG